MGLVKVGKRWVLFESLTELEKEQMGLIDSSLLTELEKTPIEIKEKPCYNKKKRVIEGE